MSTLSRQGWSDLLFEAVFRPVSMDAGDQVRVINVTPRFISYAVPTSAIENDDPVGSFCSAFRGITENEALELFNARRWTDRLNARRDHPPEFFAQLYLTCLVASATEYTHGQGQFQQRFSTLLGLPERDYLIRYRRGLPKLWHALSDWLDEDGAAQGYLGLQVPSDQDVGGQTRIGHTKMLSFPGYRDQEWLAKAAADHKVDAESPPRDILKAIRTVETRLTAATQREYRLFVQELLSGREFEQTPFWAAFEATSWRPTNESGGRATLSLLLWRIQSELKIEYGIRGIEELPAPWSLVDVPGSGWRIVRQREEQPSPTMLSSESRFPVRMGAYPRQWREGCLVMVEGEEIPWVSHLGLSPGDRTLLLTRRNHVNDLVRVLRQSVEPDRRQVSIWGEAWEAVGPLEPGDWMGVAAKSPLSERFSALSLRRYGGGGPRLKGGVRTEIGWLINEATAPVLKSRARKVEVELDGQSVGSLTWNMEKRHFAFPRDLRVELRRRTAAALLSSAFAGRRRAIRIAPCVVDMAPPLPPSLLYESDQGQLCRHGGSPVTADPPPPLPEFPSLKREAADLPKLRWTDADIDPAASGLIEAILGATCAAPASGISYERVWEFLDNALPVHMNRWVGLNELVSNGHVCVAMGPHSPAVSYRANPVAACIRRGRYGAEARLIGLIGQRLRFTLCELVEAQSGRLEVAVATNRIIPGATRISGIDNEKLSGILADAGIPAIEEPQSALLKPGLLLTTEPSMSVAAGRSPVEEWTGRSWRSSSSEEGIRLTRWRAGDRPAIYAVHLAPSIEWRTQARQWAFWVWAAANGMVSWNESAVSTPQPPPKVMAEWALLRGSGWCGHNDRIGSWVAPLGLEAERIFLNAWIRSSELGGAVSSDRYRQWMLARFRGWRGRYHPMLHRHSVSGKEKGGAECG